MAIESLNLRRKQLGRRLTKIGFALLIVGILGLFATVIFLGWGIRSNSFLISETDFIVIRTLSPLTGIFVLLVLAGLVCCTVAVLIYLRTVNIGAHDPLFCRFCGYNLTGLADSRCPECGNAIDNDLVTILNERVRNRHPKRDADGC